MNTFVRALRPYELTAAMRRGQSPLLPGVRHPAAFSRQHIAGASNLPLQQVDLQRVRQMYGDNAGRERRLSIISDAGRSAEHTALRLQRAGLREVALLDGGLNAWRRAGLPLRAAQQRSTQHLLQAWAGVALLLILAKALLLHPVFYVLLAVLGAALLVNGLLGTWSPGSPLDRMPWRRRAMARAVR